MTPNSKTNPIDFATLSLQVGQVFNPNTPVSEKDLFSGRTEQINRVIDVIFQRQLYMSWDKVNKIRF